MHNSLRNPTLQIYDYTGRCHIALVTHQIWGNIGNREKNMKTKWTYAYHFVWCRETPLDWQLRTRNSNCGYRQWSSKRIFEMVCIVSRLAYATYSRQFKTIQNTAFNFKLDSNKKNVVLKPELITFLNNLVCMNIYEIKYINGKSI